MYDDAFRSGIVHLDACHPSAERAVSSWSWIVIKRRAVPNGNTLGCSGALSRHKNRLPRSGKRHIKRAANNTIQSRRPGQKRDVAERPGRARIFLMARSSPPLLDLVGCPSFSVILSRTRASSFPSLFLPDCIGKRG